MLGSNRYKWFCWCWTLLIFSCQNSDKISPAKASIDQKELKLRLAYTREQRALALVTSLRLSQNEAVLVLYPRPRYQHYFTEYSPRKIEIAFVTEEGLIDQIATLGSRDTEGITSSGKVPMAIISSHSWFSKHGIKHDTRVHFSKVVKQIKPQDLPMLRIKRARVYVELALNERQRTRGLMYRDRLSQDEGMLFIYREPQKLSFWMRNTRIPLSIAYIRSDWTISSIHDMKPLDESSIPSLEEVQFALEVNQGWFNTYGIKKGDKLRPSKEILQLLDKLR
jgi:hypothetical protein